MGYYAPGSNRGAYVKLHGPDLVPQIVKFTATKASKLRARQQISITESSAMQHLRETLMAHRLLLTRELKKRDHGSTGIVTLEDWAQCMENALPNFKIPW